MTTITLAQVKEKQTEIAAMIAKLEQQTPSFVYQGNRIDLAPGEIYVGTIITPGEYGSYHLILLPGEAESVDWEDAKDWALKQNGELPNRVESALLFATLNSEFKKEWYWTREESASDASFAWYQKFANGYQDYGHENDELRARAVRRVPEGSE